MNHFQSFSRLLEFVFLTGTFLSVAPDGMAANGPCFRGVQVARDVYDGLDQDAWKNRFEQDHPRIVEQLKRLLPDADRQARVLQIIAQNRNLLWAFDRAEIRLQKIANLPTFKQNGRFSLPGRVWQMGDGSNDSFSIVSRPNADELHLSPPRQIEFYWTFQALVRFETKEQPLPIILKYLQGEKIDRRYYTYYLSETISLHAKGEMTMSEAHSKVLSDDEANRSRHGID